MQTSSEFNTEQPRSQSPFVERGTVTWFGDGKGFGFIARDNGERDAYVHFTDIVIWNKQAPDDRRRRLNPGERVEFEVVHGFEGKPKATKVRVISN
jgi:CspA family cold shock protein